MKVWVVFESHSWSDADHHIEWDIYGIYNSEAKAKEVISIREKELQKEWDSLSEWEKMNEWEEISYRVEEYSVL